MTSIHFKAKIIEIHSQPIIHLPKAESSLLPSRGMVMVKGTINDATFHAALEPDGLKSHWFKIEDPILQAAKAKVGDTVEVAMETVEEWLEPEVPEDIRVALDTNSQVLDLWEDITPAARWDWIRWIRATKNPETRKKRIEVALSKMKSGKRRPCCFNRNMCTDMFVCPSGVLPQING